MSAIAIVVMHCLENEVMDWINPQYQTTATLASGDSDRLCYFDRSEVVATAIDRS